MTLSHGPDFLHVEQAGDVTVARPRVDRLDSSNAEALGRHLNRLTEGAARPQLCLDLGAVEYLSSEPLGKIIALHHRVRWAGGKLRLENVRPLVYEVLATTRLTEVFDVRPNGGSVSVA
jgi:anti-anti-sigma factor